MVIGIIGASLAGLVTANELVKKGHQVIVFEKNSTCSGKLESTYVEEIDRHIAIHQPIMSVNDDQFNTFLKAYIDKGILEDVTNQFKSITNKEISMTPFSTKGYTYYAPVQGFKELVNQLTRRVDIKFEAKVVGLTYIGNDTKKKASWMIILDSFDVFELDAIIIATPAPQAYAVLENSQDETPVRKAIADINKIRYEASYSLIASFEKLSLGDWAVLEANDSEKILRISKYETDSHTVIQLQTPPNYYYQVMNLSDNEISDDLTKEFLNLFDLKGKRAISRQLFKNIYQKPEERMESNFIKVDGLDGQLGITGDYFIGEGLQSSFISGMEIAKNW